MEEGRSLIAVSSSTGSFHTFSHPRRATGEDTDTWQHEILLLETIEELGEVRTTKVSGRAKASEQTPSSYFLEMLFTNVLHRKLSAIQDVKSNLKSNVQNTELCISVSVI